MKISFQGERVAFTLNLSFKFRLKPGNKVIREFRKQERINSHYSKLYVKYHKDDFKPVAIN